jgi:ABC-type dipeptide/oligopeptide/nickel transport system permease subunit
MGLVGGVVVGAFAVLAALGGTLAPYRPSAITGATLQAPGTGHLLGTNGIGQDVATQLILGTRVSLVVAVLAGVGTVALGGIVGIGAGWSRGWVDAVLMRFTDVVLVLPKLPLLLLVGALTGGSVVALAGLIAATFWPMTARILRSQVLTLRSRTHIRAATGFGAGSWYQLRHHILPDLGLLLIADLIPAAGRAVALQAGLAFLGVGNPAQPSWGAMMRDALNYPYLFETSAWLWWLVPPVLCIMALVIGVTLLGTAAETRVSPRLARHQR